MEDRLMGSVIQDSQKTMPKCRMSISSSGMCALTSGHFLFCNGLLEDRKNCPMWKGVYE